MTKSELIRHLSEKMPGYSKQQVEMIIHSLFEAIIKSLEKGDRIELRGFGSFFVKKRDPRHGCDPRSGKSIRVDTRFIPFFRAGKLLLESVN